MKHAPEPWAVDISPNAINGEVYIIDAHGNPVVDEVPCTYEDRPPAISRENAERIVACVNACRNIPTAALEEMLQERAEDDSPIVSSMLDHEADRWCFNWAGNEDLPRKDPE